MYGTGMKKRRVITSINRIHRKFVKSAVAETLLTQQSIATTEIWRGRMKLGAAEFSGGA